MLHWLIEFSSTLLIYFDAIFTLAILLPICGALLIYDTIRGKRWQ